MRIKWHYFCDDNSVLQEVLRQYSIQFDVLPGYQDELLLVPSHLVFDIFEDSPFFTIIRQQIPDGAGSSPSLCFADNELDAAQWLRINAANPTNFLKKENGPRNRRGIFFFHSKTHENTLGKSEHFRCKNGQNRIKIAKSLRISQAFVPGI